MNEINLKAYAKMFQETFNDSRKIAFLTPEHLKKLDGNATPRRDIFMTEDGEFIDFEIQYEDVDVGELVKYIEIAENLYEKLQKPISIYVLCPKNSRLLVKECPIKSDADFKIRIACSHQDPCHMILNHIKHKTRKNISLDHEDIQILHMLPVNCAKKDRHYFRMETLRIINENCL